MIRTIRDFTDRWNDESESTLKILSHLTNDSLQQGIPGGRTIGRLANHIIETHTELPHKLGLPIQEETPAFNTVKDLIAAYKQVSDRLLSAITSNWNDNMLEEENNMYGENWKKGFSLWVMLVHQIHHRAQMTALMRFAGLKVPGIYGPGKEEWLLMNMQPPE